MSGAAGKLLFDFDRIDEWSPRLDEVLIPLLPNDFADRLHKAKPEYVEDACVHVLETSDKTAIVNAVLAWLASADVAAYHGTRVTAEEASSIMRDGLLPLEASQRKPRLIRALSRYPEWPSASARVDGLIAKYGEKAQGGRREGQVHLTLSRPVSLMASTTICGRGQR